MNDETLKWQIVGQQGMGTPCTTRHFARNEQQSLCVLPVPGALYHFFDAAITLVGSVTYIRFQGTIHLLSF